MTHTQWTEMVPLTFRFACVINCSSANESSGYAKLWGWGLALPQSLSSLSGLVVLLCTVPELRTPACVTGPLSGPENFDNPPFDSQPKDCALYADAL